MAEVADLNEISRLVTTIAAGATESANGGVLIELGPHLGRYWPYVGVNRNDLQRLMDLCAPEARPLPFKADHPWNRSTERTDDISQ